MGDGSQHGYGYRGTGYLGLGYPSKGSPNVERFKRMLKYMRQMQDNLFQRSFSEQCEQMLENMISDLPKAVVFLTEIKHSQNPYFRQPVLIKMDISAFVKTLFELPSEDQVKIFHSLDDRFGAHRPESKDEQNWLEKLIEALQAEADKAAGVAQWQLQSRIDIFLRPHLITQTDEDQP